MSEDKQDKPKSGLIKKERNGGIFDTPYPTEVCIHPEHRPPTHIHIPPDHYYRHVCPRCGSIRIIQPGAFRV